MDSQSDFDKFPIHTIFDTILFQDNKNRWPIVKNNFTLQRQIIRDTTENWLNQNGLKLQDDDLMDEIQEKILSAFRKVPLKGKFSQEDLSTVVEQDRDINTLIEYIISCTVKK